MDRGFKEVFLPVDSLWALLVVISLLGLLISYDSIAAEKDGRSLPMVLSSNISRGRLFIGKYIGLLLCLLVPLLSGFILSLLIVNILEPGFLNARDWLRILTVFGYTIVFGSLFVTAGLLISSLAHEPSVALISGLLIWVFVAVFVPVGGVYLARTIRPLPDAVDLPLRIRDFFREFDKDKSMELPDFTWLPIANQLRAVDWRPSSGRLEVKIPLPREWMDDLLLFYGEKLGRVGEIAVEMKNISEPLVERPMLEQVGWIGWLERLSPLGVVRHLAEAYLGTDSGSYMIFLRDCRRYREVCIAYLAGKLKEESYRTISPVSAERHPSEREFIRHITGNRLQSAERLANEIIKAEREDRDVDDLIVKIPDSPDPEPLPLADFPSFTFERESPVSAISRTTVDLIILLSAHGLLFALGLVAIIRYDPR
jgi:hypothetical protein